MRRYVVAQLFDGEDGFESVMERNEVLGLQLIAAAGREVHAEVGQAFIPGAGNAHLLRAAFG